jgi:outer membrane protein assembly factor BamB
MAGRSEASISRKLSGRAALAAPRSQRGRRRWLEAKRWSGAISVVAIGAVLAAGQPVAVGATSSLVVLTTYLGGAHRANYQARETRLVGSAASLHLHWTAVGAGAATVQPVVSGGVVYWGDWAGQEHATLANGIDKWAVPIGQDAPPNCTLPSQAGVASTATVATQNGKKIVFVGGGDARFYALDATTGAQLWSTTLGSLPDNFIWSSPLVSGGQVYIGLASFGDCPLVAGKLFELDASTGNITHVIQLTPPGCVGAGLSGSPALDRPGGNIYIATGNEGDCTEPLSEAIVELRSSDLSIVSSWQIPRDTNPQGDSDFINTPTLFTATIQGKLHNMVGVSNKNGIFYALNRNRVSSGPVWQATVADPGACPQCGGGSIAPTAFDGSSLYAAGGSVTLGGTACGGSVQALDPATGSARWQDCLDAVELGAPLAVPGAVVINEGAHTMVLGTSDGAVLKDLPDPSGGPIYSTPSVAGGIVYVTDMAANLLAFGP